MRPVHPMHPMHPMRPVHPVHPMRGAMAAMRLDRTSFYACAGGGCGSTTGAEVWLPLVVALGFGIRRPRARRRTG
jgi:hypothetical protein